MQPSAQQNIQAFIGIDDDPINNMIAKLIILEALPSASVINFTDPEEGLAYMQSTYSVPGANHAILLLDINMPILTGWDVLDKFKTKLEACKLDITIFMLSSSIDPGDKQKAAENPLVSGYIEKPITIDRVQEIYAHITDPALTTRRNWTFRRL